MSPFAVSLSNHERSKRIFQQPQRLEAVPEHPRPRRHLADVILTFAGQIAEEDRWSLIHFLRAGHSLEEEQ
jgi:hypothetical protein